MRSIRIFLIVATLSSMVLVGFISAVQGYRSSLLEAESLFDSQLQELAQFAANLRTDSALTAEQPAHIAFQIWDLTPDSAPQLLIRTNNAPEEPMATLRPGFDYANFSSYRWRTHVFLPADKNIAVIAASRTDIRYQLAENVILEAIFPIILGLPLSGLLIWWIVGQGLRPLNQLAANLREKQHRDLTPVTLNATPQELHQVINSVNGLLIRLNDAFEREKRFASDAAHELRTPISVLKLQLHNLEAAHPEQSDEFQALKAGVQRMQHLVEQILALYRSTPEQIAAHFVSVNLKSLVENVIADNYSLFEDKQQQVEFCCNITDQDALMEGDAFALQTLVGNLLNNASKYTQAGGLVTVELDKTPTDLRLRIEDNGPGIPEQERRQVFQRFHRVKGDRHDSGEEGCGLGLAIVENIALLHGGSVHIIDTHSGQGTCFEILFPNTLTDESQ